MDSRLNLLQHWIVSELGLKPETIEPASADASFRRYFRVTTPERVFIAMDAPPEKESVANFVDCARALAALDIHVPHIFHENSDLGFLLLEDLGVRTYLDELKLETGRLYGDALTALLKLQSGENSEEFAPPLYDAQRLNQEMDLFIDWYLGKHINRKLTKQQLEIWDETKKYLTDSCLSQPQTWVHRDYHSRNLMITAENSPGVIDFQDIMFGPIAYDLASLFKDCYIEWPRKQQLLWLEKYRTQANLQISSEQFIEFYDLAGLQRHLKVLGIFCRLNYRDRKSQYLGDLPLVANYILEVLELYPRLSEFKRGFARFIEQSTN